MKDLGKRGEDLTAVYYQKLGFKLVAKNYFFPHGKQVGEIDLIFCKEKELVFVEVKTRTSDKYGGPFEAVDLNKQRRLVKTAKLFMLQNSKWRDYNFRIDVAAVDIDPVRSETSNGVDNQTPSVIIIPNAIEDFD